MSKRKSVIVLTGARQVGKSTTCKENYREMNYITLNRPLVRESARENPSLFFQLNQPPIIIDEFQKVGEMFDYIKDIVDESGQKGLFFLTGSQNLTLMKRVGDSLAGRAGVLKMLGLSMREIDGISYNEAFRPAKDHFLAIHQELEKKGQNLCSYREIAERIHRGFYPELYHTTGDLKDWMDYYSSYFQTYLEKDIRDVLRIQDESAFIRFVRATAALTGQLLNLTSLAEICGKDVKTVTAWLSVLESCGIVYLLQPYYNNFNKRLLKTPKLYFLDTGLACFLLGWNTPEQLTKGAMWGHMFESFVIDEVLKSYYNDGISNPPLYFYRDKEKNEIDLVIEEGDTLYPVEIKTSSDPNPSMAKQFRCLEGIPGKIAGEGAILCLTNTLLPLGEKLWAVPVGLI
jgi:predicted AAA+ superfamily ATPase